MDMLRLEEDIASADRSASDQFHSQQISSFEWLWRCTCCSVSCSHRAMTDGVQGSSPRLDPARASISSSSSAV